MIIFRNIKCRLFYFLFVIFSSGCVNNNAEISLVDLDIYIKTETERIDFKNKTFERNYLNGPQKITFKVSKTDEVKLLNFIIENKFLLKDGKYIPYTISDTFPLFNNTVKIKNKNGTFYGEYCSNCSYFPLNFKAVKLQKFANLVFELCYKDENVKSLPNSDIAFD